MRVIENQISSKPAAAPLLPLSSIDQGLIELADPCPLLLPHLRRRPLSRPSSSSPAPSDLLSSSFLFLPPKARVRVLAMAGDRRAFPVRCLFFFWISSLLSISLAYRPGDIVPMSKAGQYHGVKTRTEILVLSGSVLDPLRFRNPDGEGEKRRAAKPKEKKTREEP